MRPKDWASPAVRLLVRKADALPEVSPTRTSRPIWVPATLRPITAPIWFESSFWIQKLFLGFPKRLLIDLSTDLERILPAGENEKAWEGPPFPWLASRAKEKLAVPSLPIRCLTWRRLRSLKRQLLADRTGLGISFDWHGDGHRPLRLFATGAVARCTEPNKVLVRRR